MSFTPLSSLSDEALRQERNRRIALGLALFVVLLFAAFLSVRIVLQTAANPTDFMKVLILIAFNMAVAMLVAFWMSRPLQERTRRKRLVLRQAIGTFPAVED